MPPKFFNRIGPFETCYHAPMTSVHKSGPETAATVHHFGALIPLIQRRCDSAKAEPHATGASSTSAESFKD